MNGKLVGIFSILILAYGAAAQAGPGKGGCSLGDTWETIDQFQPHSTDSTIANGMASNSEVLVVVGENLVFGGGPAHDDWVVRVRDLATGAWKTTQVGFPPSTSGSGALGVAAGPQGELYAVGFMDAATHELWITEKSTDNGATWKTVDSFAPAPSGSQAAATSVAVDGNGNVTVSGLARLSGGASTWTVRRSTDGGTTWSTVDQVVSQFGDASPFAVAATDTGTVFVAGRDVPVPNTTDDTWFVRSSTDGTTWRTVDQFLIPKAFMNPRGAAIGPNGEIVITGSASESDLTVHWLARKADVSAPTAWTTIDDYLPAGGKFAAAVAATFSLADELFTTGTDIVGTGASAQTHYLTRRGFEGSAFANTDSITSPLPGNLLGMNEHSGNAATTDSAGNVYTAGTINTDASNGNHRAWIVRELGCD